VVCAEVIGGQLGQAGGSRPSWRSLQRLKSLGELVAMLGSSLEEEQGARQQSAGGQCDRRSEAQRIRGPEELSKARRGGKRSKEQADTETPRRKLRAAATRQAH
jgi:hypothetical protein